jgi:hypothetical protein
MPNAGDIVHANDVIQDDWTTYTPQLTSTGTAFSLGNGIVSGRYTQAGSVVWVNIKVTMGSSTTFGTGFYRVTLPVAPEVDELLGVVAADSSSGFRYPGQARMITASASGDNMRLAIGAGTNSGLGATTPFTWAQDDVLIISGSYKAA